MKTPFALSILLGCSVAFNTLGQGQVIFSNTPSRAVIDWRTGLPVAPGVARAGLYYSTDLTAQSNSMGPADAFSLAAVTPISRNATFAGVYSGGTVTIIGAQVGQEVLLQVWTWSQPYGSWQEAWDNQDLCAYPYGNSSNLMRTSLGGGTIPIPSLSIMVESFYFCPIPEPSMLSLGLFLLGGLGVLVALRRSGCHRPVKSLVE